MNSKISILCFLICIIAAIYASPYNLPEDHSLSRAKRDTCRYLFGWCGNGEKCCPHLGCGGMLFCVWDGKV
uniref:Salivary toxin-like peptide n=1 Tax=Nyssomyia intermedia TaxID=182990 RepID=J7HBS6_9DIPT